MIKLSVTLKKEIKECFTNNLGSVLSFYADSSNYRDNACSPDDDRYVPTEDDLGNQAKMGQDYLKAISLLDQSHISEDEVEFIRNLFDNESSSLDTKLSKEVWG